MGIDGSEDIGVEAAAVEELDGKFWLAESGRNVEAGTESFEQLSKGD